MPFIDSGFVPQVGALAQFRLHSGKIGVLDVIHDLDGRFRLRFNAYSAGRGFDPRGHERSF
jgi:hypothetical protein